MSPLLQPNFTKLKLTLVVMPVSVSYSCNVYVCVSAVTIPLHQAEIDPLRDACFGELLLYSVRVCVCARCDSPKGVGALLMSPLCL